MADGRLGQQGQRGIIEHRAVGHQHAAVAVAHVFAEADVGDDDELGPALLEAAHGLLHNAVLGVGRAGFFIFFSRNAEEQHGHQARVHGLFHLLFQFSQRELVLAGHGSHFLAEGCVFGFHHKIGHDQVFHQQGRSFAHQGAEFRGPAQPTAAMKCLGHSRYLV